MIMYNVPLFVLFNTNFPIVPTARRQAAARKMKQLKGEDTDNEQNDDDLLAEMNRGLCVLNVLLHNYLLLSFSFSKDSGLSLILSKSLDLHVLITLVT